MAPKVRHAEDAAIAREEAPELPYVNWRKDPGLRKLYMFVAVLMVASATTGYDGYVRTPHLCLRILTVCSSLLDKSQNMEIWQEYFNRPTGANMGRLQAMYQIGSVCSMPVAPFIADRWGRKASIVLGCTIMIIASALQTSSTGQPMFEGQSHAHNT